MKTKRLSKKLRLNKKTVSNLNVNEMKSVKGGGIMSDITGCTNTNLHLDRCQLLKYGAKYYDFI